MHIGRVIIIPAILALGVAGSVLTGSAVCAATVHAPSVQVQAATVSVGTDTFYHG